MIIKRLCSFFIAGVLVALLSACGSSNTTSKEITTVSNTSSQAATTVEQTTTGNAETVNNEQQKGDFVMPVEGMRPFAVMIDNEGSRPLPQGGLNKAQIIYEIIAEGGVTRLMPVFWNVEPEMIGPVRSSRHYFIDYAMEHDAMYVHFGYSPQAQMDIKTFKINNVNGVANGGEVFWDLTKDRKNWQDSYTSMKNVQQYIQRVKYRTTTNSKNVFSYNTAEIVPSDGQKAENIQIKYSNDYRCSFKYDAATGTYLRFRKDKPHMERTTDKQLTAKNIIIQYVGNNRIKGDTKDRQELGNVGSGKGLYITCGKAVEIKWSKASRTSQTKYMYKSGEPVQLNQGQTWIQVVPKNNPAVIE
jgi:hypothetical protein